MKIPYPTQEMQNKADSFEAAGFIAKDHVICGEVLSYKEIKYDMSGWRGGLMLKTTNERLEHITLGPCTLIGYRAHDMSDPSDDAPLGNNAAVILDNEPDPREWGDYLDNRVCKTYLNKKFFFAYNSALRPLTQDASVTIVR